MAYPKEIKGTLALLGAAAAAVVAVLLGVLYWSWSGRTEAPQNATPAQTAQNPAEPQPAPGQPNPSQQAAAKPGAPSEAPAAPAKDAPIVPSFDLVRVEPDGESVIASDIVLRYTYSGDANLDGIVDVDDYLRIDFSVLVPGLFNGYENGDFDLNGVMDVDDYGPIDFNFPIQTGPT